MAHTAISGSLQPISPRLQLLLPVAKGKLPDPHVLLSPQRAGLSAMPGIASKHGVLWKPQTVSCRVWCGTGVAQGNQKLS